MSDKLRRAVLTGDSFFPNGGSRLRDDTILNITDAFDLDAADVSDLEVLGWLHGTADAGGAAGRQNVAGLERKNSAELDQHLPEAVDELTGAAVLAQLAIHPGFQGQIVDSWQPVRGDEPGPERTVGVEGLAEGGGRGAHLPFAHAHVVADREAGDHLARLRTTDVPAAAADDDGKLSFVVEGS